MLLHHLESLTNFIEVQKSNLDVSVMVLIGSIAWKTGRQESTTDIVVNVNEDYCSRFRSHRR